MSRRSSLRLDFLRVKILMVLERFEVDKAWAFYLDFPEIPAITVILEILEMGLLRSEITEILEILDPLEMGLVKSGL